MLPKSATPASLPRLIEFPPLRVHPEAGCEIAAYKWAQLVRLLFAPQKVAARVYTARDKAGLYNAVKRYNLSRKGPQAQGYCLITCKIETPLTSPKMTEGESVAASILEEKETVIHSMVILIREQPTSDVEAMTLLQEVTRLAQLYGKPTERAMARLALAEAMLGRSIHFPASDADKVQSIRKTMRRFVQRFDLMRGSIDKGSRPHTTLCTQLQGTLGWELAYDPSVIAAWRASGHSLITMLEAVT